MMGRKLFLVALAVVLSAVSAAAQTGDCGAVPGSLTCVLGEDGVLTVSGVGRMANYSNDNRPPWYDDFRDAIAIVIMEDGVTSVGNSAFMGCANLTTVTVPNSVMSIGDGAFLACTSLTTVAIPNSVASIGHFAFGLCTNLTTITIPNSVTSIGERAFYGCNSLTTITVTDGVTSIGKEAFSGCTKLTTISIPNSVTTIDDRAFSGCCSLAPVTIPLSVTSIGRAVFEIGGCPDRMWWNSGHTIITLDEGGAVTVSGLGPMGDSDNLIDVPWPRRNTHPTIKSIIIEDGVTKIGLGAFLNDFGTIFDSLTSVTIANSVTSIGGFAFVDCLSLTSVTIPSSVTYIGPGAFGVTRGCGPLTSVISLNPTPPVIESHVFGVPPAACLYVPVGSVDAYRTADMWSEFDCVTDIDSYVSVAAAARIVPQAAPEVGAAIVTPVVSREFELTVGPNPLYRTAGRAAFFYRGEPFADGALTIYNALGSVVRRIAVNGRFNDSSRNSKQQIAAWDLRDEAGRLVPHGTYLVNGVINISERRRVNAALLVSIK